MYWSQTIDGYCERLGPGLWAEPLNAVTNLAFLIAALLAWRRAHGLPPARLLAILLALIGFGSGLFHILATRWASALDVLSILAFVLVYVYLATRDFFAAPKWMPLLALPATVAALPLAVTALIFAGIPAAAAGYLPIAFLILAYAAALRRAAPVTARNLAIGAALLILSITFRALDHPLCAALPMGTHFLWHILNAIMLAWMIETYRRHMLATRATPR